MEKTLIIFKPEIPKLEREILNIEISKEKFQKIFLRIIRYKGFNISKEKKLIIDEITAKEHYADKKDHPLFNNVIKYISSDISTILSIQGEKDTIKEIRNIAMKMRKKYIGNSKLYNLIHSSDSEYESNREHKIHFDNK